jgi:hypothetical protein
MQANEASANPNAITIELVLGTEGIQAGCCAITVRRGDLFTQTPWLIVGQNEGEKIARSMVAKLQELYPGDPILTIGFDESAA